MTSDQPPSDAADLEEWMAFSQDQPSDEEPSPIPPDWLTIAAIIAAVVTLIGIVLLRPTGASERSGDGEEPLAEFGVVSDFHQATVEATSVGPCEFQPEADCTQVVFRLDAGPDAGSFFTQVFPIGTTAPEFEEGERVILAQIDDAPAGFEYQYSDRQRRGVLLWVALAFGAAVVLLGRLRGLAALGGLAGSVAIILMFILPAILDGRNPVLVAVVGSSAIAFLALYLAHGFRRMTTVALLGTLSSLALTAALSGIVVGTARFSGLASEESTFLAAFDGVDVRGLVLAGIVLGAAGALDDVTVTQASAVWQLKAARPDLSVRSLFRSGLQIGRDHIASTVNTLLLAYTGAALPLLILAVVSDISLGTFANSEDVAVEIVRTLVGSIGLVAAVPITTWLAARSVQVDDTDAHVH